MIEIQEEISSFEPGVFEPTQRTLVRFEFEECICDASTLPAALLITTSCYSGTAVAFVNDLSRTCKDVIYAGEPPGHEYTVTVDFLGPQPAGWKMTFGTGEVLLKVSNFDPNDPICSTPQGNYEGDGCTAQATEA